MKKVLLVCGGGASSGFLAQSMSNYAKKNHLDITVDAIGEPELEDYIDGEDLVLLCPHLKYLDDEIKEITESYKTPSVYIPEEYYATMDGEKTIQFAVNHMKGE